MYSHETGMPPEGDHMHETPAKERKILTADDIREHIGSPENIEWVKAGELTTDVAESCVDGREQTGVISTAGGNAGEFVLAVQAAEELAGTTLTDEQIHTFFTEYLQHFGRFYMHTDGHALHHLGEVLAGDAEFAQVNAHLEDSLKQLLSSPPEHLRAALLEHLTNPDTMGCGHLKLMIKDSEEYGVRPEIVQAMVRAYYTELWNQNPALEYVILPGDHEEGAVVLVTHGDGAFDDESDVPTIAPLANGTSFFANHPQAISYLRNTIAQQVADKGLLSGLVKPEDLQAYQAKLEERGNQLLMKTVEKLAVYTTQENGQEVKKPLPIFKVAFTSHTEFSVEQVA